MAIKTQFRLVVQALYYVPDYFFFLAFSNKIYTNTPLVKLEMVYHIHFFWLKYPNQVFLAVQDGSIGDSLTD